jgi:hypothetical protein
VQLLVLDWVHVRFVAIFQGLLFRSWRFMHFDHIVTAFLRGQNVNYQLPHCVGLDCVIIEVTQVNPPILGAALKQLVCLIETQHLGTSPISIILDRGVPRLRAVVHEVRETATGDAPSAKYGVGIVLSVLFCYLVFDFRRLLKIGLTERLSSLFQLIPEFGTTISVAELRAS